MTSNPTDIGGKNTDTLGSLFRNTRRAQHRSVEDAADATRIHTRIICALEEDNYKQMPAEVFVRGFIKLYSEFLGLDPEESISKYVLQKNAEPDRPADTPYRNHILFSENYVSPPVYQKNKKRASVIAIGLVIFSILLFIVSLLPEITNHDVALITIDKPGQVETAAVDDPGQKTPAASGSEIMVDRPPAITIQEESIPREVGVDTGSSEPEENTRVLDQKLYKISKKKANPDTDESSIASEETATAKQEIATQKAPPPSPEPIEDPEISDNHRVIEVIEAQTIATVQKEEQAATEPEPDHSQNISADLQEESPVEVSTPEDVGQDDVQEQLANVASEDPEAAEEPATITPAETGLLAKIDDELQADPIKMADEKAVESVPEPAEEQIQTVAASEIKATGPEQPIVAETVAAISPETEEPPSPAEKPVTDTVVTTKPSEESEAKPDLKTALPATPPAKYTLKAKFLEPTWMRIKVDNKRPRQYTYKPGMTKTWKANRSIYLHLGNGGGVKLSLNGRPLPTGVPSGKVAKIRIPDDIP